jgi:hypothetical protein
VHDAEADRVLVEYRLEDAANGALLGPDLDADGLLTPEITPVGPGDGSGVSFRIAPRFRADQLRRKEPKTRAGRRSVTLSPWLLAELRAHRLRQQEQRLSLGMGRASDDSPVFATLDGSWRTPNSVSTAWSRLADELGFPEITLHALRHTHVSQLIASGADVVTVARRIGHGNPSITLAVYSHLFGSNDQAAADATEMMFRKATVGRERAANKPA